MKLKNKKAIHLFLVILLILLILFFMLFLGKAFSKYKKGVNSNAIAEVATPIFVVDGTENIKIDGIEDTLYKFSVKNYKGTDISEVDMNYNVQIVNNSDANLEFELIKNGEKIVLTNNTTELMNVKGGAVKATLGIIFISLATFIAGLIDGYIRPLKCNI